MGETEISWTHQPGTVGRTWNPVQGCRRISPGCERCYAERLAARFAADGWSHGLINLKTRKWNGEARLATHKLDEPLRWRKPATVFVNSMSDLFFDRFTNEEIAAVFGVMAACPQHTFQVLTKRATRMREWFEWIDGAAREIHLARLAYCILAASKQPSERHPGVTEETRQRIVRDEWPLPNVWLGVSVENQDAANERIPELLKTPAAIRFLSCEPLIGPVDVTFGLVDELFRIGRAPRMEIDWVIAGCESGPGARTCDVAWLRSLRNQCASAGVAFFLKQATRLTDRGDPVVVASEGSKRKSRGVIELPYLDGVQHAAFPEVRHG